MFNTVSRSEFMCFLPSYNLYAFIKIAWQHSGALLHIMIWAKDKKTAEEIDKIISSFACVFYFLHFV